MEYGTMPQEPGIRASNVLLRCAADKTKGAPDIQSGAKIYSAVICAIFFAGMKMDPATGLSEAFAGNRQQSSQGLEEFIRLSEKSLHQGVERAGGIGIFFDRQRSLLCYAFGT